MLQNLFSIRQFRLTKWSFLVHSTTRNAPNLHPSHDSILELWRTFPECCLPVRHQSASTSANSVESTSAVRRGSTFHGLWKGDVDVTEIMRLIAAKQTVATFHNKRRIKEDAIAIFILKINFIYPADKLFGSSE